MFSEGGRLEEELKYTNDIVGIGSGTTAELIIQTPNKEGANVLGVKSLQLHLQTLMKVTNIEVDMFDT